MKHPKTLKIRRLSEGKFTVAVTFEDYSAFPYDGTFPDIHQYYVFDTEAEMIDEIKKADWIFTEEIDAIYYGKEVVTEKYLEPAKVGYKLLECWSV